LRLLATLLQSLTSISTPLTTFPNGQKFHLCLKKHLFQAKSTEIQQNSPNVLKHDRNPPKIHQNPPKIHSKSKNILQYPFFFPENVRKRPHTPCDVQIYPPIRKNGDQKKYFPENSSQKIHKKKFHKNTKKNLKKLFFSQNTKKSFTKIEKSQKNPSP
jgi:hypothetical protein